MYNMYDGSKYNKKEEREFKISLDAIGNNEAKFKTQISLLKQRWPREHDGSAPSGLEEVRKIIYPLFEPPMSTVRQAVVVDNLSYFLSWLKTKAVQLNKELEVQQPTFKAKDYLDIACLCGSKQIVEFIMKEMKIDYLTSGYEYILAFASASPNKEWALEIAKTMSKANKSISDKDENELAALADSDTYDAISKIFEKPKPIGKDKGEDIKGYSPPHH